MNTPLDTITHISTTPSTAIPGSASTHPATSTTPEPTRRCVVPAAGSTTSTQSDCAGETWPREECRRRGL